MNALYYGDNLHVLREHLRDEQAEREFDEIIHGANTDLAQMMKSLRSFLGDSDMMANRLLELHRVLKPTGSLYLHCVPISNG